MNASPSHRLMSHWDDERSQCHKPWLYVEIIRCDEANPSWKRSQMTAMESVEELDDAISNALGYEVSKVHLVTYVGPKSVIEPDWQFETVLGFRRIGAGLVTTPSYALEVDGGVMLAGQMAAFRADSAEETLFEIRTSAASADTDRIGEASAAQRRAEMLAIDVCRGDLMSANHWLTVPQIELGGLAPYEVVSAAALSPLIGKLLTERERN